jgi:hypothetical protein
MLEEVLYHGSFRLEGYGKVLVRAGNDEFGTPMIITCFSEINSLWSDHWEVECSYPRGKDDWAIAEAKGIVAGEFQILSLPPLPDKT